MSDSKWGKIEEIIDAVLDLPENRRAAYLEENVSDESIKKEVYEMLQSITESDGWLEGLGSLKQKIFDESFESAPSLSSDTLLGTQFGSYTITKKIGEGGMGIIYLAKRTDDSFDHQVAIKIIKNGRATEDNIRRFKREQQILARLNHPGIAQLYDGGITSEGFPYIIMEYVDGVPITEYCEQKGCSVAEKIKLIKKILHAVQNAHENLTIHRDLKPDNILIDSSGNVKILDFGISKLLEDDDNLMLTKTGSKILTPRYAAPEQIKGERITTATDMYSLGVIFYKLLTNSDPYNLEDKTQYQVEQCIINEEPRKPSDCVSDSALRKKLLGDLDAIVLKAIRKEPEQRYRVASEFLEDLKNYDKGLPVKAHDGSFSYNAKKFIKRNKQPILYIATAVLLLTTTTIYYTIQLTHERNLAKTEADTANEVTDFLIDLFEANDPSNSQGKELSALQLLHSGERKIDALENQPRVQAKLMEVLGSIYSLLSIPDKADSLKSRSVTLSKNLYTKNDPELAYTYYSLAQTKHVLGDYDQTLALLDTAITYQNQINSKNRDLANSLRLQAETLKDQGKLDSAYQVIKKSQSIFTDLGETETRDYYRLLEQLGAIQSEMGEFVASIDTWNNAIQISKNLFEPPHPDIINSNLGLAYSYKELKEFAKAESLYIDVIDMAITLYGEKHLNTAVSLNNLAGLYYYTNDHFKADSLFQRSYVILEDILGTEHPSVISVLYNRANLKSDMGDYEEAEILYKRVLDLDIEYFGEYHQNVASDHSGIATLLKNQGKFKEAEDHYLKSLEIRKKIYDNPDHPFIARNLRSLADIMARTNRFEEADSLYRQSIRSFIKSFGIDHSDVKNTAERYLEDAKKWGYSISADSLIKELS